MNNADRILLPRWTIPVAGGENSDPATVLEDHAVVIVGDRIAEAGARSEVLGAWESAEMVELDDHVLIPGLVNAHTHAAMTLLRGFADDLPLMEWLSEYIWPTEARCVDRDYVAVGTDLAMLEMIRGGTTCFQGHVFLSRHGGRPCRSGGHACNRGNDRDRVSHGMGRHARGIHPKRSGNPGCTAAFQAGECGLRSACPLYPSATGPWRRSPPWRKNWTVRCTCMFTKPSTKSANPSPASASARWSGWTGLDW